MTRSYCPLCSADGKPVDCTISRDIVAGQVIEEVVSCPVCDYLLEESCGMTRVTFRGLEFTWAYTPPIGLEQAIDRLTQSDRNVRADRDTV